MACVYVSNLWHVYGMCICLTYGMSNLTYGMSMPMACVLSDFINLRSAECVCSYYGLRVCSQIKKKN